MRIFPLALLFTLCSRLLGHAQTADPYVGKMLNISHDKVYLSFDKPYYSTGEIMYFKAFLTNATNHVPDSTTTVLYVDFLEMPSKRLILQQKLKAEQGHASGSFNTEGVTGNVFVHAYTRSMQALAADYHFNKNIQVFDLKDFKRLLEKAREAERKAVASPAQNTTLQTENVASTMGNALPTQQNATDKIVETKPKIVKSLQFFPESGHLVTDFLNRLAFKATDSEGKGIAVKGIVRNEKGDSIARFEDTFLGMGRFNLVVKKGENYTAHVDNADGTTTLFPLPKADNQGVVMGVDQKNDTADLRVTFFMNYDTATMPNTFFLAVHQRDKVCYSSSILVKNKQAARISKMTIPYAVFKEEGIATLTLFDDRGRPIAERLAFIQNKKRRIEISLTTQKAIFEKRERVTVTIDTKTADGQPIAADVSFAVTNNEKIAPPQYLEDLRAYMSLRSDLRGYIEQPSFYFEDTTATARLALDNLMMTQGWRRFNWTDKVDTAALRNEQGMVFQGIVRKGKTPLANASLVLILTPEGENNQTIVTSTDKKGRFIADNLNFTDTARLFIKPTNSSKNYTIEATPLPVTPSVSEPQNYLADQPSGNFNAYLESSKTVVLSEKLRVEREIALEAVVIKAKKQDPLANDKRLSKVPADRKWEIKETDGMGPIRHYLEARGIGIGKWAPGESILVRLRKSDLNYGYFPYALVIDGLPEQNADVLNRMFIDEVERIDIVDIGNGGFSATPNTQGVVHVLTKRGNVNYWKNNKNTIPNLLLQGYTVQKQFYTPDYAIQKPEYAYPDHRATLYWSPIVRTDAKGQASVSFYTSDDAQNARILVEGIDQTGKIGVAKAYFKVN